MSEHDALITEAEAAELLSVQATWLRRGRTEGFGPPWRKLSRKQVRYSRADVLDWSETCKRVAA